MKTESGYERKNEGKVEWHLLPWEAIELVARVVQHGCKKYSKWNWSQAEDGTTFWDCAQRHLQAHRRGEYLDPVEEGGSGLPHLAHAACNILMMLEVPNEVDNRTLGLQRLRTADTSTTSTTSSTSPSKRPGSNPRAKPDRELGVGHMTRELTPFQQAVRYELGLEDEPPKSDARCPACFDDHNEYPYCDLCEYPRQEDSE